MDLAYLWFLQCVAAPDHNTIARFRKEHLSSCVEDLFTQLIKILAEHDEIQFENLFVDGTKIEANANKYTFVWRKATEKNERKLQEKALQFLKEKLPEMELPQKLTASFLTGIQTLREQRAQKKGIRMVYGSGKRKTQEQRDIETLSDFTKCQQKYESYSQYFGSHNSFS